MLRCGNRISKFGFEKAIFTSTSFPFSFLFKLCTNISTMYTLPPSFRTAFVCMRSIITASLVLSLAAGIIDQLSISRKGNLTCPVSSGVILAGFFDPSRLQSLGSNAVGRLLYDATQGEGHAVVREKGGGGACLLGRHLHGQSSMGTPRVVNRLKL
jgi:hypothetical protein